MKNRLFPMLALAALVSAAACAKGEEGGEQGAAPIDSAGATTEPVVAPAPMPTDTTTAAPAIDSAAAVPAAAAPATDSAVGHAGAAAGDTAHK